MQREAVEQMMVKAVHAAAKAQEEALDAKLHELDGMDDEDLERMREKRLREMKKLHQKKIEWKRNGHGTYKEIPDEREFFEVTKNSRRVVCHFYRPTTKHCWVVDKHFQKLCMEHLECRFIKINAEKSPYLCEKLNIWMMPTMVCINERKTVHSIIGFDELGGTDAFTRQDLKTVLAGHGMIDMK